MLSAVNTILNRLWRACVLTVSLIFGGSATHGTQQPPPSPTLSQRVAAVRQRVGQVRDNNVVQGQESAPKEGASPSQWGNSWANWNNWNNWNNWGNWHDWNQWQNFGNWGDR